MRDIVLRLTNNEAALIFVMLEELALPTVAGESDERKAIVKPVLDSAMKKLKTPLKRRKVI